MKHPIQPIENVDGVARYKSNAIINYLLENGPFDMNALARLKFNDDDRTQFAMLFGYSVSGARDLSYFDEETTIEADKIVVKMRENGEFKK